VKSQATSAGRAFILVVAYFCVALLGGWLLKRYVFFTTALAKLPAFILLMVNAIFVLTGVPLSAIGDLLLLKKLGISYLYFWPFFVAMASWAQISFFRSSACHAWALPLKERLQRRSKVMLLGRKRQSVLILLIRSVPLMPFMLGSFVIAMLPRVSQTTIISFSIVGCYLYYGYFGAGFLFGSSAFGG
jgi:hypothetical protein